MMSVSKLTGAGLVLSLLLACGSLAAAQQTPAPGAPQPTPPAGPLARRHMRAGRFERRGMARDFGQLNLTDAQRQQMRAIRERYGADFRARREEMRKLREQNGQGPISDETRAKAREFRQQMRESNERMRAEILAVLTPEQRTQLEQKKSEFKARREEMRARRKAARPPQ